MTLYAKLLQYLKSHFPSWLREDITYWTTTNKRLDLPYADEYRNLPLKEEEPFDALLIGARVQSDEPGEEPKFRLFLDLDQTNAVIMPSSTKGHCHVIIDTRMTRGQHDRVMAALASAGVIQEGYAASSRREAGATLRLPWVRKPTDETLREQHERELPF